MKTSIQSAYQSNDKHYIKPSIRSVLKHDNPKDKKVLDNATDFFNQTFLPL